MAEAVLGGDDCYGDDPSVRELEERVAALLGKEAALFCPSGTMSNQLAVHTHCRPGESIAAPALSHVQLHEDGSASALSGTNVEGLGGPAPHFEAEDLRLRLLEETHGGWPRIGLAKTEFMKPVVVRHDMRSNRRKMIFYPRGRSWPMIACNRKDPRL